jgi:hypothetical protein
MTHNDQFIERLENYLDEYEGVTPLPDAVRHAIRAELPRTKQIGPPRGLSRFLSMTLQLPASARYGLAAAVVLVAVVIGASILGRGGSVGDPGGSPSPSPPPPASVTPSSGGPLSLVDAPSEGDLPAGEYSLDLPAFPARIEFDVPEGWWYFWPTSRPETSDVHGILVNSLDTGAANGSGWGLSFLIVNQVRVDPCSPAAGYMDPSVTQSADALATAFGTWADFSATVEDVTVGGYSGKRVEITRTGAATCQTATAFTTPTGYYFDLQAPASLPVPEQYTILDVDGSVLVIWTTDFPATSPFEVAGGASPDPEAHVADQVELHGILDSIVIQPR